MEDQFRISAWSSVPPIINLKWTLLMKNLKGSKTEYKIFLRPLAIKPENFKFFNNVHCRIRYIVSIMRVCRWSGPKHRKNIGRWISQYRKFSAYLSCSALTTEKQPRVVSQKLKLIQNRRLLAWCDGNGF